jgi:hypothetical protein
MDTVAQDSDGNAVGPDALVYALLTVVVHMAEKRAYRSAGVRNAAHHHQPGALTRRRGAWAVPC